MSSSGYVHCTMCTYCTTSEEKLIKHVYTIHRHDPNFHVYCASCLRSYHTLSSFRKHVSRGCRTSAVVEDQNYVTNDCPDEDMELEDSASGAEPRAYDTVAQDRLSQQWHEARFILSIKERHGLSQAAVDQVLSSTTELVSALLDGICSALKQELPEEWMQLVEKRICETRTLFSDLSSPYFQEKYFKEKFHLVVR